MRPSPGLRRVPLFASTLLTLLLAPAVHAADFLAINTNDAGAGSLRAAIEAANASPGADAVGFDISGPGPHVITLASPLPPITDALTIDGYDQFDSAPNTTAFGAAIDARIQIEIDGDAVAYVLQVNAPGTVVRGLAIHGGTNLISASDVVFAGNFLGTDASGTVARGPAGSNFGVRVTGPGLIDDVTIGGPDPADRNLIVASSTGIQLPFVAPGPGTGYVIQGNYIGTDVTGTLALSRGIGLNAISNARVIGNVIAGNPQGGLQITDNNIVQGNRIGTTADGSAALPNGNFGGIQIQGGGSLVGGDGAGEGNVIAHHANYGIVVYNGGTAGASGVNTRNRFSRNAIFDNAGLGISINYSAFPLANDAGDTDSWAADSIGNDGQNSPVLTSAVVAGGNVTVAGTLDSLPNGDFTLEFFANAACHAKGVGEGAVFLGATSASTDAGGDATFGPTVFALPDASLATITATATDALGNTSEFSACVAGGGGVEPTTTVVTSSQNPSIVGDEVIFTATVDVVGTHPPGGAVRFKADGVDLDPPLMGDGSGVYEIGVASLAVGTHAITAEYQGDAGTAPSASAPLSQVVQVVQAAPPGATSTTLVSSLNPSMVGDTVTFTATVGGDTPTGNVTFLDAGVPLGTVALAGGSATLATSALAVGTHPVTAAYAGDAENAPSVSSVLLQVVEPTDGEPPTPLPPNMIPSASQWSLLALLALLGWYGLHRIGRRDV